MDTLPLTPEAPPTPAVPPVASTHWAIQIIGGVLVAAILILGGWLYSRSSAPVASPSPTPSATADAMTGWKTYTNTQYGFSLKYPDGWTITTLQANVPVSNTLVPVTKVRLMSPALATFNAHPIAGTEWQPYDYNVSVVYAADAIAYMGTSDVAAYAKQESNVPEMAQQVDFNGMLTWQSHTGDVGSDQYGTIVVHNGHAYEIYVQKSAVGSDISDQILSTFQFTNPSASCIPRPACLDTTPRCLIAEPADGWCPTP